MQMSEGKPYPLGATADAEGTNFAVFSGRAGRVAVCIFDAEGGREIERLELPGIHQRNLPRPCGRCRPPGRSMASACTAYEARGGHRFNVNKLLLDPYARAHAGKLVWDPAVFGYTLGAEDGDLTLDERDSAPFVPKSVVVDPNFDWRGEYRRRNVP